MKQKNLPHEKKFCPYAVRYRQERKVYLTIFYYIIIGNDWKFIGIHHG